MSHTARAIVRFFLGLVLWWLFFAPAFYGIWTPHFLAASALALVLWTAGVFLPGRTKILDIPFIAAILAMAAFNQNKWLLPPALMGGLFLFTCIAIIVLRQKASPLAAHPIPWHVAEIPAIRRFLGIFAIWGVGAVTTMLFPVAHAHIVLMFWTCLMVVLNNEISVLTANSYWIGYKTRRECFVSTARWRLRFFSAGILFVLWIAFCLYKVAF